MEAMEPSQPHSPRSYERSWDDGGGSRKSRFSQAYCSLLLTLRVNTCSVFPSFTTSLDDSTGLVRLLNVVNSLEHPLCQRVTRQWEAQYSALPPDACIYTVSMDSPQMQARWQDSEGVLHQALSAQRSEQFGQDYG